MLAALLTCTILQGVGSITIASGIVDSARYEGATVEIVMDEGKPADILVNGPYDRAYSYVKHGIAITAAKLADRWLIDAKSDPGMDVVRESMIITDMGRLLWVQMANADQLRTSSASVFTGICK